MPKLREALKQTSGTDVGGNEFTLQETDIQPYIDNPEIAKMEAEVTQARYGGTPIQAPGPPGPGGPPGAPARKGPVDFSRRADFENSVFKQLATDNMPDGNPFNFNTTASLNAISKQDLPELFGQVFRGEVTWSDRHLLDDDQKKYWMSEVKRFRAHIQTSLDDERQTAIASYNQMMNQFDNAAKEAQAAGKLKRETTRYAQQAKTKQRERGEKKQKGHQANLKRRTELLTKERELTQAVFEAEGMGGLSDAESAAFAKELQGLRDERKAIDAELNSSQVPKPKSAPTPVKGEAAKPETKPEKGESPTVVRKKVPKKGSDERTIVKTGTIKKGPNKGRKVIKYSDGSMAYADEIK